MRRPFVVVLTLALVSFVAIPVSADVKLPSIIGEHMVLQAERPIPFWGWADAGEKVVVEAGGRRGETTAGADGRWKVVLEPIEAGGPITVAIQGKNAIRFQDVLVGDNWVCSGQSNMQFAVANSNDAQKEIAAANYPKIRLFSVERRVAHEPQTDCKGEWVVCTPQTVPGFSAVGYFFGRDLHKELGTPVGLIHTSWGGTPAESWTTRETLEANPLYAPLLKRWADIEKNYPEAKAKFDAAMAAWREAAEKAKAEGKAAPRRPGAPTGPDNPHNPSTLYNAMIAPIVPFGIGGAIWYQGESNAGRAYQYRTLFRDMIEDWRMVWGQGDFPFLFVQLANFMATKPEPVESEWAELREAQTMTLSLPRTGMALAIDIGEANDIHPRNKQEVGRRLALAGLAIGHRKRVAYSGPRYGSMDVEGKQIRIQFRYAYEGLVAKGGEPLKGFAIAGKDRKFVWADARIDGRSVVVWSDKVPEPVAVRYAWADNPVCNLYNGADLPAVPFRTDNWPGLTIARQ
ncbi:MAG: sialate O-acetylesterase [Planctomycetes bacterium]|nr:sialate O-acetylesterase [Planctomycetota bacterium]